MYVYFKSFVQNVFFFFLQTNKNQWGNVFLYSALAFFVGNLFYILFGSAEIQPWNQPKKTNKMDGYDNEIPDDFMN